MLPEGAGLCHSVGRDQFTSIQALTWQGQHREDQEAGYCRSLGYT